MRLVSAAPKNHRDWPGPSFENSTVNVFDGQIDLPRGIGTV